jgi:hypothetical protein
MPTLGRNAIKETKVMICQTGGRSTQRGFGALVMMMGVLVLGASSVGVLFYSPRAANAVDERKTGEALAIAKDALIAYAVRRGDPTTSGTARPGELPCPDTNNDGVEESSCSAGAIGRLPWKTLGIAEPKDAAFESLWYAVAGPFRTKPSNTNRINSNTRGNLVVRAADGSAQLTGDAVAVIFAPGTSLNGQNRDTGTASCPTTGTSIARNRCAANYLETSNGVNNAQTNGPFVAGTRSDTYNDRVLYIGTAELIPAVEMRVGNEMKDLLLKYRQRSQCHCYPWADSWSYSGGIADVGLNRGRFPSVAYPENWGQGTIPVLPAWITANDWQNIVYYAAGRLQMAGAGLGCYFCSLAPTVTVDGQPVSAIVFTPGLPPPGIDRSTSANRNNLGYYLEDAANQDGDDLVCPGASTENANKIMKGIPPNVPLHCDAYAKPTSKAYDRDRIYTVTTTPGA